ncbi:MAG: hypothetical protein RRB13_01525 [bacterium]|nr:hypothetical protein [bacterium]
MTRPSPRLILSLSILALGLVLGPGWGIWAGLGPIRQLDAWQAQAPPAQSAEAEAPLAAFNRISLTQELEPAAQIEALQQLLASSDLDDSLRARIGYELGLKYAQSAQRAQDPAQALELLTWAISRFEQVQQLDPGEASERAQTNLTLLRPHWAQLTQALADREFRRLAQLPPEALVGELKQLQRRWQEQKDPKAAKLGLWALELLERKTQDYPLFPDLKEAP